MEKPYLFASTETVLGVSVRALALSVAAGAFKRRVPVISESTLLSLLSPLVQTLDLRLLFERPLLDFLGLHLFAVLFRFARLAALLANLQLLLLYYLQLQNVQGKKVAFLLLKIIPAID